MLETGSRKTMYAGAPLIVKMDVATDRNNFM